MQTLHCPLHPECIRDRLSNGTGMTQGAARRVSLKAARTSRKPWTRNRVAPSSSASSSSPLPGAQVTMTHRKSLAPAEEGKRLQPLGDRPAPRPSRAAPRRSRPSSSRRSTLAACARRRCRLSSAEENKHATPHRRPAAGDGAPRLPTDHMSVEKNEKQMECDTREEEEMVSEGGWSWLIVVAVAMSKMAFWGALPCFGIMFADVLETSPGNEGATIASIISLFSFCLPISGLLCPALYHRFSFRQVGVAGGLIYFAGSLSAAFAASTLQLVLTYGAVQGAGFGLVLSSSLASFNEHFRVRRTVAMAVAQCAIGAGSLALPLAAQQLQAAAGARAAKLAFAGLGAVAAACQLLLRPPPPRPPPPAGVVVKEVTVAVEKPPAGDAGGRPASPAFVAQGCEEYNKKGIPTITRPSLHTTKEDVSKWGRCARWARRAARATGVDVALLRDARVMGVAVGLCLAHVEELNFFAMFPLHARALGLEDGGVARAVATATAGDFAGRVALVVAGRWLARSNRLLFAAGALASAAAVIALSFVSAWEALLTLGALLGLCKGVMYVTYFLTLAEIVAPAKFPSAMAIALSLQIGLMALFSFLLGLVRDATQSYPACFRVMAALLALCVACFAVGWRAARRVRPAPAATTNVPVEKYTPAPE